MKKNMVLVYRGYKEVNGKLVSFEYWREAEPKDRTVVKGKKKLSSNYWMLKAVR